MRSQETIELLRSRIRSIEERKTDIQSESTASTKLFENLAECKGLPEMPAESEKMLEGFVESSALCLCKRGVSKTISDPLDSDAAYRKILKMLSAREFCTSQVRDRLARAGFDSATIEIALDRAVFGRIIDDQRFADAFMREELSKGKGIAGIRRKLRDFGISLELDSDEDCSFEAEVGRALEYLRKRPSRSKYPRESAYRRLLQRGYSSSVASTAATSWVETLDES